jgi:two-component system cell cycle sensor histidine kinase/response regulator CckA
VSADEVSRATTVLDELREGTTHFGEWRMLRKDGSTLIGEMSVQRLSDGRLMGLLRDITVRKRVEAEHQASEMSLRALLNATTEVAFLMDKDGVSVAFNDAVALSMGVSLDQIHRVSVLDLLPPELAETRKARLEEVLRTGKPVRFEDYGLGAWWDNSAFPVFDDQGNVVRLAVFARDITERKRLEEQLIQSQKMEAIGRLAGGLAHDFNNLLTVIMGHTDLAKQEALDGTRTSELLDPVLRAGARAADLTRQLLAFARKQIVSPRIISIDRILRNIADLLRSLIGEDIELIIEVAPDIWRIKVDPGQFDQVLVNLVVNSRDAMPHGGKLTIHAKNLTIGPNDRSAGSGMPRGEYIVISVADTGHGMTLETQKKIFEPFYTTKDVGKGTGLGLSTCHGIISQAGGNISVCSERGHGATFEIYLPRAEGIEAPVELSALRPSGGRETIMLVEDETTVRTIASQSLRAAGYDVIEASSGSEALTALQSRIVPIDLLVTDVVMPQMSGRELVRRCEETSRNMKVLYISGYAEKQIVNQILDEGAAFLSKPFTPSSLTAKVREILDAAPKSVRHGA